MKKYTIFIIFIILFILLFELTACSNKDEDTKNNIYPGTRLSVNINEIDLENNVSNNENTFKEELISSYATTIKDNSQGRLTNISITCSTLNNTIIHNGETFSFNEIVGKPTSDRGYKEASVIIDGKTEKGIGGGNCQVSSTLYNAVLNLPNLNVTERHEHGKDVTYVPDGKDAAVSYGSLDLKFVNNLGYDIRIDAITDNSTITINIIKIS